MTKSFDELAKYHSLSLMRWDEDFYASENTQLAKAFYEAGQQSKQAEIDELQKRIDGLITSIDWHIEDCELWLSMNKNDSWKGGQLEILKAIKKRFVLVNERDLEKFL